MGKYSIDDLKLKGPTYRSQNGETLSFRVWMGHCMLAINGANRGAKAIFSKVLREDEVFMIGKYMQDLIKDEPGKEISLVYNSYNRQEKKRVLDYILILKKDEKKVYHVIIKSNGQTFDFPILGSTSFSFGTGAIPNDERSYTAQCYLIQYLKTTLPVQVSLSSFPSENQGGYGGGQHSGYSGQSDFQSSKRNLPSDDDIFSQE